MHNKPGKPKINFIHITVLLFSALAIRICAFHNTLMMNLDGPVYIHQARAIYHGLWSAIGTCCSGLEYPTVYTILIAAIYPITGNWMNAAMMVNLIFGTLMIVPLYLFLRRFVDEKSSFVASFIFTMLPILAIQSVNVIRDPSYWFFSILGLYLLVYDDEKRSPFFLVFSSLSLILATATRLEAVIFFAGGCLYTALVFKGRRLKATLIFLSPVFLSLCCFIIVQLIRHPAELYWYRFQEIPLTLINAFGEYRYIRENLTKIFFDLPPGSLKEFIENSRTLVWFTALGVVAQRALEAYFYIFFLVLILGIAGVSKKIRTDIRILPLIITTVISLVVLYLYCLNTWSMENRRLIMAMLPSVIFVGFGVEKIISWMRKKFNLSESVVVAILCAVVLLVTLPKNIKIQEADKLVFKEVGETVARLHGGTEEIEVLTLGATFRWINYFANLHVSGAPCPEKSIGWRESKGIIEGSYKDFINDIRNKKIHYIIWQEKHWPKETFPFLESIKSEDLEQLKEWKHRDTGRIILYKVLYVS